MKSTNETEQKIIATLHEEVDKIFLPSTSNNKLVHAYVNGQLPDENSYKFARKVILDEQSIWKDGIAPKYRGDDYLTKERILCWKNIHMLEAILLSGEFD